MSALFTEISVGISRASGSHFSAVHSQAVHGGDISRTFKLSDGARTFFIKLQSATRIALFETEAAGLAQLHAARALRVPQVLCHGIAAGQAYLVLEYLPLVSQGDAALLGRQLAQQHRVTAPQFGWARDNWIGATPQPNGWRDGWVDFWREQRLGFQLRLAAENGYGGALQREGEILLSQLPALFGNITPQASLLHGDLWGGNHGFLVDGAPVVFDPAVYFGDRECDLAMSELFGGFSPDFYAAYREVWPLDAGYAVRKTLYNLYHVLNHANLFGGSYVAQAACMTAQLLAQLR